MPMAESDGVGVGGGVGEGGRGLMARHQDFMAFESPWHIKQYMNHKALVIALYVVVSLAQIAPPRAESKLALKNLSSDSEEGKALSFLLKAHPQLQSFAIFSYIETNSLEKDGNSPVKGSFIFKLRSDSKMLLARVIVGSGESRDSVSLSPAVTSESQLTLPPLITLTKLPSTPTASYKLGSAGETSIINQPVIQLPTISKTNNRLLAPDSKSAPSASSQLKNYPPGSYQPFGNLTDSRLNIATQYLTTLHPNMINYRLADVQYQITAGINFMLNYTGRDEFTRLLAFINVDLKLQSTLLDFFVMCNSSATSCTEPLAGAVFAGEEALIGVHPQLSTYCIVSLVVEDNNLIDTIMTMITFEDTKQKLRALAELKIVGGKSTVQSYYSYSLLQ